MHTLKGFLLLEIVSGLLYEHDDGNFNTLIFGFTPKKTVELPSEYTHFGFILQGSIELSGPTRKRRLEEGDFFSVSGQATISQGGFGIVCSAKNYQGMNVFGGPVESQGRLRYIDGCTDSLLVPPVRKGDPCLNHLHFPSGITQTPHTHPSVRAGVIYKGLGECLAPEEDRKIPLIAGSAFLIGTNAVHSFNTGNESMDVIAFHPDSDTGMTDDDHPMVNRTIVQGTSARFLEEIRTRR